MNGDADGGSSVPRVTAVVIFLDAERYLAEAIDSVLAQSFDDWQLILVDDGSTDGSREIADAYTRSHADRILVVEHPGRINLGMSAARNRGVAMARGELIAFLDADDRWPTDKLERQVAALDEVPDAALAFGHVWQFGNVSPGMIGNTGLPAGRIEPKTILAKTLLGFPPLLTTMGSTVVRIAALRACGAFEPAFRGQAEDAVMWSKLALRHPFVMVDAPTLEYRRHHETSGATDARAGVLAQGHLRFARWLVERVRDEPPVVQAWATPLVEEHFFRWTIREAWDGRGFVERRRRLAASAIELWREGMLGSGRAIRVAAQVALGQRSGAVSGRDDAQW